VLVEEGAFVGIVPQLVRKNTGTRRRKKSFCIEKISDYSDRDLAHLPFLLQKLGDYSL
jgi:hypothetical protein